MFIPAIRMLCHIGEETTGAVFAGCEYATSSCMRAAESTLSVVVLTGATHLASSTHPLLHVAGVVTQIATCLHITRSVRFKDVDIARVYTELKRTTECVKNLRRIMDIYKLMQSVELIELHIRSIRAHERGPDNAFLIALKKLVKSHRAFLVELSGGLVEDRESLAGIARDIRELDDLLRNITFALRAFSRVKDSHFRLLPEVKRAYLEIVNAIDRSAKSYKKQFAGSVPQNKTFQDAERSFFHATMHLQQLKDLADKISLTARGCCFRATGCTY